MKLIYSICLLVFFSFSAWAQSPDVKEMYETAKNFMRTGDYANAILVLSKATQQAPDNNELKKDLAYSYFLNRDFANAKIVIKPLVERDDADIQTYQIAGTIYRSLEENKESEKIYKKAIKLYPKSGVLHYEYGDLLWQKNEAADAIEQWEAGIEGDPNYSGNYYSAAKYYYFTADRVWTLVYGETFINLESYTVRTAEIKTLLLDAYKKFFSNDPVINKQENKNNNAFVNAFTQCMNNNSSVVSNGVTPESLMMLRTRFIIEWSNKYNIQFPMRLYEHHKQLLEEGMFEAYNQWVFGVADNLSNYESWTKAHPEETEQFTKLQKNKIFKIPGGQYYHKK